MNSKTISSFLAVRAASLFVACILAGLVLSACGKRDFATEHAQNFLKRFEGKSSYSSYLDKNYFTVFSVNPDGYPIVVNMISSDQVILRCDIRALPTAHGPVGVPAGTYTSLGNDARAGKRVFKIEFSEEVQDGIYCWEQGGGWFGPLPKAFDRIKFVPIE